MPSLFLDQLAKTGYKEKQNFDHACKNGRMLPHILGHGVVLLL